MQTSSFRSYALITSAALLVMAFAAMYAEGYVRSQLILPGNGEMTAIQLKNAQLLFYSGIIAYGIILLCDLAVSWSLYKLLQSKIALISSLLRVIYIIIFGVAIYQLLSGNAIITENVPAAMDCFKLYETIWSFALVLFGVHLILTGSLFRSSVLIPKWLSIIIITAGFCYSADNLLKLMEVPFPILIQLTTAATALTGIVGETGLAIALLIRVFRR